MIPKDREEGVVDEESEHQARPNQEQSEELGRRKWPAGLCAGRVVNINDHAAVRQHVDGIDDHVDDMYQQ